MPSSLVTGLVLAVGTGLLWAVIGVIYSQVARCGYDTMRFQLLSGLLICILAWAQCDWSVVSRDGLTQARSIAPVMLGSGVVTGLGFLFLVVAMRQGSQAGSWTIAQSSMLLPFLSGVLLWHESLRIPNIFGVALTLGGIACFGLRPTGIGEKKKAGSSWLPLILLAFALTGIGQTLTTVPTHWAGWADVGRLRVPLAQTGSLLAIAIIYVFRRDTAKGNPWKLAVANAVTVCLGQCGLYAAMDRLAMARRLSIVYPLCITICIVGFGLYSRIWLRERLGLQGGLGLLLGVVGIVLMQS